MPEPIAPKPILVPDNYTGRFKAHVTVLEDNKHGPQMCASVQESYPPQCGGPDLVGFTWDGLPHESAGGTRWGAFTLIGTWDGTSLTLTEKPTTGDAPQAPDIDFASPCDPPSGGWKVLDETKTGDDAMRAAQHLAQQSPDFAGVWIDDTPPGILNVRYTKDLGQHEAELRKVWGGALCVSPARHTEAELRRIQDELAGTDVLSSSTDVMSGTVEIGVWVAYEKRQRDLDAKYGPGLVTQEGVLRPID